MVTATTAVMVMVLFAVFCAATYCVTHSLAWHSHWVKRSRKQESYLWSKAV